MDLLDRYINRCLEDDFSGLLMCDGLTVGTIKEINHTIQREMSPIYTMGDTYEHITPGRQACGGFVVFSSINNRYVKSTSHCEMLIRKRNQITTFDNVFFIGPYESIIPGEKFNFVCRDVKTKTW